MTRREKAISLFKDGYNCAQAIVLTFADLISLDEDTLSKVACSFGGGMGRLREVCGAVSGAFIVLSLLYGYSTPETGEVKAEHYKKVQEVARRFEEKNGSIVCRELLGLEAGHSDPTPTPRSTDFYEKRPCPELIGDVAEILEKFIEER